MNMRALLLPLLLAVALPSQDAYEVHQLPPVASVHVIAEGVFLFHKDGSTTLLPSLDNLEFRGWIGHGPIVATVFNFRLGSQEIVTTYIDDNGKVHRIITKCRNGEKAESCVGRHDRLIKAFEKKYPKAKVTFDSRIIPMWNHRRAA